MKNVCVCVFLQIVWVMVFDFTLSPYRAFPIFCPLIAVAASHLSILPARLSSTSATSISLEFICCMPNRMFPMAWQCRKVESHTCIEYGDKVMFRVRNYSRICMDQEMWLGWVGLGWVGLDSVNYLAIDRLSHLINRSRELQKQRPHDGSIRSHALQTNEGAGQIARSNPTIHTTPLLFITKTTTTT